MTGHNGSASAPAPSYIKPLYQPDEEGVIHVYAGELLVTSGGETQTLAGDVELRLTPRSTLTANASGRGTFLSHLWSDGKGPVVELPAGASVAPPTKSGIQPRPQDAASWGTHPIGITRLQGGDITQAERLLLHIAGPVGEHPLPTVSTAGGEQGQISFELSGWTLRLAAVSETATSDTNFSFVAEAIPTKVPFNEEDADRVRWQLFLLLSFVAGKEIGIGPVVGIEGDNNAVWAEYGAMRMGNGQWRWCSEHLVADALPVLAQGLTALSANPSLEKAVHRTIGLYLAANGRQVLDARIPLACVGLELLSWAVLQHHQGLSKTALKKMPAGAQVGRLLQWAGVPTDIPAEFKAILGRKKRINRTGDWLSNDAIFNVRNALVHPPKKFDAPEWPKSDELTETWRLSMDHMELALLRVLQYEGHYLPRLQLTARYVTDTESVPWT